MNVAEGKTASPVSTLLIDTSYVIFAKYYSTLSWYKMSINRNPEVSTVFESAVFKNKFEDLFIQNINKIVDKHCDRSTRIVFAKDCNRNMVWRRQHYDGYKESRTQNGNFNSEAFRHAYNKVIPRYIQERSGSVIGYSGAEGDDVIGVIHSYVRDNDPGSIILILTNDNDCIQLVDDNTRILNLLQQDVGQRKGALTARQYLTSRILAGDRSDNIPSIAPRCGPRTAARLATEKTQDELRELYGEENYNKNDLLMNMQNVPEELRRGIIDQYDGHPVDDQAE